MNHLNKYKPKICYLSFSYDNLVTMDKHPIHLHGFNFFILGSGLGNYNPNKYLVSLNSVNHLEFNIVGVPTRAWTVVQFVGLITSAHVTQRGIVRLITNFPTFGFGVLTNRL